MTRLQLTNFRSYAAGELAVGGRAGGAGGPQWRGQDQCAGRDFAAVAGARACAAPSWPNISARVLLPADEALWAVAATVARGDTEYEIGTGLTQAIAQRGRCG